MKNWILHIEIIYNLNNSKSWNTHTATHTLRRTPPVSRSAYTKANINQISQDNPQRWSNLCRMLPVFLFLLLLFFNCCGIFNRDSLYACIGGSTLFVGAQFSFSSRRTFHWAHYTETYYRRQKGNFDIQGLFFSSNGLLFHQLDPYINTNALNV